MSSEENTPIDGQTNETQTQTQTQQAESPNVPIINIDTVKILYPHYTDAQAESHLRAHVVASVLREMVPPGATQQRVNLLISQIVNAIALATR